VTLNVALCPLFVKKRLLLLEQLPPLSTLLEGWRLVFNTTKNRLTTDTNTVELRGGSSAIHTGIDEEGKQFTTVYNSQFHWSTLKNAPQDIVFIRKNGAPSRT
jgi:hypothetical protein